MEIYESIQSKKKGEKKGKNINCNEKGKEDTIS